MCLKCRHWGFSRGVPLGPTGQWHSQWAWSHWETLFKRTLGVVLYAWVTKRGLLIFWALEWEWVSITARIGQSRKVSQLGIFAKSSWGIWFYQCFSAKERCVKGSLSGTVCLPQAGRSVYSISSFSPLLSSGKVTAPSMPTAQGSFWFSVYHLYLNYFQFCETFVTFITGNLSTFIF